MELSRVSNPIMHFDDDKGHPLADGFLFTYEAGTSAPIATYKSNDGTKNPVKIQLDSRGECEIWLDPKKSYKFILKSADGSYVREEDNVTASAHVKATIPFAVDEDDFEMNSIAGALVLSLKHHEAVTNTSELVNDGDGTSKFLTEDKANGWTNVGIFMIEVEDFITWNHSSCFINEALGLCVLNIACFAKVNTSSNLQEMFNSLAYKPMARIYNRIGGSSDLEITTEGKIFGFNKNASANGSFFCVNVVYPYAR